MILCDERNYDHVFYFFFWFIVGSPYYYYCYEGIIEEARVFRDRNRKIGFVFFYFCVLCYFLGFGRGERDIRTYLV